MPQVVLQSSWRTHCQLGITISKLPGHVPSQPSSGLSGHSCKVEGAAVPSRRGKGFFHSGDAKGEKHTDTYTFRISGKGSAPEDGGHGAAPKGSGHELKGCLDVARRHHLNFGWLCVEPQFGFVMVLSWTWSFWVLSNPGYSMILWKRVFKHSFAC